MPGGALQHVKVAVSSRRNMGRARFPFQNEYDVGQYLDHTPLSRPARGVVVASRQTQAMGGAIPGA
jgi:hypothetical protein